ncbi:MAG TPA: hypothetical protein VNP92_29590 [Actinophytocola sp.]|nr:hypothetical protein [Actinophytocola sp.]
MAQVLISIADEARADMPIVVDALRRAGLTVNQVLDAIGVVTGSADSDVIASLSAVPGVSHVEPERTIQLPPPDSPIQ